MFGIIYKLWKQAWRVPAIGSLTLWSLACSGSHHDSSAMSGPSGSGGGSWGSGGSPGCLEYQPCDCDGGLSSQTVCDSSGKQTCDCASCPAFKPKAEEPFNACGGRAFGTWRLREERYTGGAQLSQTGVSDPITCPEDIVLEPNTSGFMLVLQDGGSVAATDYASSGTVTFLGSCAQQILGTSSCENITVGGAACSGNCGLCSCSPSNSVSGQSISAWSTTGTSLTLQVDGMAVSYDYCVTVGQLTLHAPGTQLVFDAVHLAAGPPQPCTSRATDICTLGVGCHTGVCGPGEQCGWFGSEAECNVNSACSWQPTGCGGTAPKTCALEDYGKVPGCDFLGPGMDGGAPDSGTSDAAAEASGTAAVGEDCTEDRDCQSGACCMVERQSGTKSICLRSCSKLPIAGPCRSDSECESGTCASGGTDIAWCTAPCTSELDCGVNYWNDTIPQNVCTAASSGGKYCFPACQGVVGACNVYSGTSCIDDFATGSVICSF
jgi:hypothetical protein